MPKKERKMQISCEINNKNGAFFDDEIKPRVSRKKKEANSFARQIEIMDYIDLYYGDVSRSDELSRFDVNYGLYNGDLDIDLYDETLCVLMLKVRKLN